MSDIVRLGASAADRGSAQPACPLRYPRVVGFSLRFNPWTLLPLALVTAAVAVPYSLSHGFLIPANLLHNAFALVCHQRPDRSFSLFGFPVAVCARCLGIYLGAALGLLLRTSRRLALRLLIATAVLNALDVATELARFHGNWLAARFVLGLVLGAAAALLIPSSANERIQPEPPVLSSPEDSASSVLPW